MTDRPAIGIVGLGTMGLGIAQVYAQAGFPVVATDAHAPARDSAHSRMAETLNARITAGKLTEPDRDATLSRLTVADDVAALAPCQLIIEAIVEKLEAKQALFTTLEPLIAPGAILATNTSSLPIHAIAHSLKHPERVLALHFFNPPPAMKLVELAPHADTDPIAITRAQTWTEAAGKTVILCPDRPGFIVNRCARPYYGEALAMLAEGRSAAEIDAAMVAAGYKLGPFALIDLIGADINLAATEGMHSAMGQHPRYLPFPALKTQVARGNLGRKTGKGFVFPPPPTPPPHRGAPLQHTRPPLRHPRPQPLRSASRRPLSTRPTGSSPKAAPRRKASTPRCALASTSRADHSRRWRAMAVPRSWRNSPASASQHPRR